MGNFLAKTKIEQASSLARIRLEWQRDIGHDHAASADSPSQSRIGRSRLSVVLFNAGDVNLTRYGDGRDFC
jgi:hypothetical protein